jgi:hypothetical protein
MDEKASPDGRLPTHGCARLVAGSPYQDAATTIDLGGLQAQPAAAGAKLLQRLGIGEILWRFLIE